MIQPFGGQRITNLLESHTASCDHYGVPAIKSIIHYMVNTLFAWQSERWTPRSRHIQPNREIPDNNEPSHKGVALRDRDTVPERFGTSFPRDSVPKAIYMRTYFALRGRPKEYSG